MLSKFHLARYTFNSTLEFTNTLTKILATVKGLKSGLKVSSGKISGVSISGTKITLAKAVLGTSQVTVNDGYTLALAKNVAKTSTKKEWSLNKTTATYKQTTTAGYKLVNNVITYTKAATKTLATVNGVKSTKGFTLSGKTINLVTTSLSKKVTVGSSTYGFEFASDYKNAEIIGNSSNDTIKSSGTNITIRGGKGNDTLTGGKGKDIFVYAQGDGKDVITNYNEADRISIESGAVDVSTSGKNVIFTVGTGKKQGTITLQKAQGKTITYFDANGKECIYPEKEDVEYNPEGTAVTLKATYNKDTFEPSDYSDYVNLATINASDVTNSLLITGNKKANKIIGTEEDDTIKGGGAKDTILGGDGNDELYGEIGNDSLIGGKSDDSLWGGKGSEILTGGEGNDTIKLDWSSNKAVIQYNKGDGNDVITDYTPDLDTVMILSPVSVGNPTSNKSGDVTFKIGTGQILFKNSANKYIELVDEAGNELKKYNPR